MNGKHLKSYISIMQDTSPAAVESIKETVGEITPKHIATFSHQDHIKGLLLGQVQSGKTGQMLGLIASAADTDEGFAIFILLTSDITALQQQTYQRALSTMDTFNVCDEHDEMRFKEIGVRKPSIIVLKKNSSILRKWRNILASTSFCQGRPVFIVDDEADAASLNTMVNKREQSTINTHLQAISEMFTSSFYLQVTATPQSLLLQSEESGWKPSFVHYFAPGKNYLGGDFFYTSPKPYTNITTDDDELEILLETEEVADGLRKSIDAYLVTSADIMLNKAAKVCNYLAHPSVRIEHHEIIRDKVKLHLDYMFENLHSTAVQKRLKTAWADLQKSKPNIKELNKIVDWLENRPAISVVTMNSGPEGSSRINLEEGLNIVIGGNSLGRGVTFKGLQTVYYCRSSKSPQADTFWQHCRMFGYDRDPALMRVFMPLPLFNLFAEINSSNEVLIKQIEKNGFDNIQIVTNKKLRPTRRNVVDQEKYEYLVGGVNYFPPNPDQTNGPKLDKALDAYGDSGGVYDISFDEAYKILKLVQDDPANNWKISAYINALDALESSRSAPKEVKLVIRKDRNISRFTGTMLSVDDRKLGDRHNDLPVITLYRLNGKVEQKWDGEPFWMPNIKLPIGKVFHRVD